MRRPLRPEVRALCAAAHRAMAADPFAFGLELAQALVPDASAKFRWCLLHCPPRDRSVQSTTVVCLLALAELQSMPHGRS